MPSTRLRTRAVKIARSLHSFVRATLARLDPDPLGFRLHRARDATRSKSSLKAVRGSRKAEGGKSAQTVDESADTRSNLGTLIGDIESGQLSASQASAQIASIINQRQDLQNQAAVVSTPPSFTVAADKLRESIAAALEDDYAIQAWINAWYDDDPYAYERAYAEHEQATAQATTSKADFLSTYNDLRSKHLKLAPIDVNY
jgi:hypothetical protein